MPQTFQIMPEKPFILVSLSLSLCLSFSKRFISAEHSIQPQYNAHFWPCAHGIFTEINHTLGYKTL